MAAQQLACFAILSLKLINMPGCSVVSCKNRSETVNFLNYGITYHIFPKDPKLLEQWIAATGRAGKWYPGKNSTICSAHFTPDMFLPLKKSRRLYEWAIPKLKTRQIFVSDVAAAITPGCFDLNALPPGSITLKRRSEVLGTSSEIKWEDHTIISRVYLYLEREYEIMKILNGSTFDLSPLADILKRTAEATGLSEDDVITILKNENLSEHLPERVTCKGKRRKIHKEEKDRRVDSNDHSLIEDNKMVQEEHDNIVVKKEIAEDAGYEQEPIPSSYNIGCITSSTEQIQVKMEPVDVPSQDLYFVVAPVRTTPIFNENRITPMSNRTVVKLEPKEDEDAASEYNTAPELVQRVRYHFSDAATTQQSADITIKLEPQDNDLT